MKHIVSLFLFFLGTQLPAQILINGIVSEQGSGEALAYVQVSEPTNKKGALTNEYGYFSLSLSAGTNQLNFYLPGYEKKVLDIQLEHDTSLTITLSPYQADVDTVEISANSQGLAIGLSRNVIPIKQMEKMPMLAGEADALKSMQFLPGVQFGKEGTSGLFVRGGTSDQNLILLDDVPVYNVSHLFGFASLFPPSSLKSAEIYKGGFPAEYGGRLSSVVKLQSKEGDLQKRKSSFKMSTISGQFSTEGPIVKNKSSYFLSVRRTWLDLLARPFIQRDLKKGGIKGFLGYGFYDAIAKVNYKIGENDRIYLSFYTGQDKVENELGTLEDDSASPKLRVNRNNTLKWGNVTGSIRYQKVIGAKWFMKSIVGYSKYNFMTTRLFETIDERELPPEITSSKLSFSSAIQDFSAKQLVDYRLDDQHHLQFGFSSSKKLFLPDVKLVEAQSQGVKQDSLFKDERFSSNLLALFVGDTWKPTPQWFIQLGLRGEYFWAEETSSTSLQPRLAMKHVFSEKSSISISYSFIRQYLHLLSNTGLGLPADLWVPATQEVPPSSSHQAVVGWEGKGPFQTDISLEAYYKTFSGVIEYKDGTSLLSSFDSWQNKVESGEGRAYGLELWMRRHIGRLNGWLSYTLAWNNRQFKEINQGKAFPFKYDRRHNVSLFLNYPLKQRHKSLSITWMYLSGSHQTIPVGIANVPYDLLTDLNGGTDNLLTLSGITGFGNITPYSTSRNNFQLSAFHKLDFAYQVKKIRKRHTRTWSYGIYNIYGRRNPYYIFYQSLLEFDNQAGDFVVVNRLAEQSLLFWIPNISMTIDF